MSTRLYALHALLFALFALPSAARAQGADPTTCPRDMARVEGFCIDLYEAPNRRGALPLVMYTFGQAEAWCKARDKRLCFDDEWTRACQGPKTLLWSYAQRYIPTRCNAARPWKPYDRIALRDWPHEACTDEGEGFQELLGRAGAQSMVGAESASHVAWLYQAAPSASYPKCVTSEGVYDLLGNIEEWTRRRLEIDEEPKPNFSNRLKGRFWAEARDCSRSVSNHSDKFRYYEIGFRCCKDPYPSPKRTPH